MAHDFETKSRVVAKILRELLRNSSFDTLADLTDALKVRLGELNIATTPDDLSAAFAMIGSNRELVPRAPAVQPKREYREQLPDTPTFSKSEAAYTYRQLLARYRAEQPSETIPGAPEHFPSLVRVL